MIEDLDLSRELTRVVASAAGVIDVFAPGGLERVAMLSILNRTTDSETDDAKVSIDRSKNKLVVCTTIGVDSAYPVRLTLRTVSDAIRDHLTAIDLDTVIDVKVSYIGSRTEDAGETLAPASS